MEAATVPLHRPAVRVVGDALRIEGLVVEDRCAVGLAREHEDPAALVTGAIEIGARVLQREQTAADADFVKAEFERTARELDREFVDRAAKVAERLDARVAEVFGGEDGKLAKLLARHFDGESATAIQHQVRDMLRASREDLVRQFSSADAGNPLADFKNATLRHLHASAESQRQQLEAMRLEIAALRAEREKLEAVAAEAERGTAKGRSYEELVAEALDAIADGQGDVAEAVGDQAGGGSGKKGDVLVAVDACAGPARGRIVFEVKTKRLSRPDAIRELDGALADREADYAVLVVPSEDKVPAKLHALRELNGDKLIVTYDPEEGDPLALRVAYGLARARVLMAAGAADGIDGAAVARAVDRALHAFEDVRRVKQQLTGAKTRIDEATSIVDALAVRVKAELAGITELVRAAEEGEEPRVADGDGGGAPSPAPRPWEDRPAWTPPPSTPAASEFRASRGPVRPDDDGPGDGAMELPF